MPAELHAEQVANLHVYRMMCPRCGAFEITGDAAHAFRDHKSADLDANRYLLSGRARVATVRGETARFAIKDFGAAERGEIPEPGLDEKIRLMLDWFERRSTKFGEWLSAFSSKDYPIAYCHDEHEWIALIEAVSAKGWLEHKPAAVTFGNPTTFRITMAGREYLGKLSLALTVPPKETPVSNVPAHFAQYERDVDNFTKDAPFESSVFVMMKFPDAARMNPDVVEMLDTTFKVIRDELSRYGLQARRGDDKTYATGRQLWDNLCVYMLGCKYGLAVLEDRSGEDFNPNVALEYGFMRALGRDAVLLKERGFKYIRADVLATIPKEFSIGADFAVDENSLREAVEAWMIDLDRPAKRRR